MPIPQDILSVPRPKNLIVIAYGKDKSMYAVRQRISCKRENGRNLPINGPTIGHIIDGVYVPKDVDALPGISRSLKASSSRTRAFLNPQHMNTSLLMKTSIT